VIDNKHHKVSQVYVLLTEVRSFTRNRSNIILIGFGIAESNKMLFLGQKACPEKMKDLP
jgi:hypothetical protein